MNGKTIFDLVSIDFIGHWCSDFPSDVKLYLHVLDNLQVRLLGLDSEYSGLLIVNHIEESEVGINYLDVKIGDTDFLIRQIDNDGFYLSIPNYVVVHFSKCNKSNN